MTDLAQLRQIVEAVPADGVANQDHIDAIEIYLATFEPPTVLRLLKVVEAAERFCTEFPDALYTQAIDIALAELKAGPP